MPSEIKMRLTVDTAGVAKLHHTRLGVFLRNETVPPRKVWNDTWFLVRWWHSKRFEFLQEIDKDGNPIAPRLIP